MSDVKVASLMPEQLVLKFNTRYTKTVRKRTDKAVQKILDGLVELSLEIAEVNDVMSVIAGYNGDVKYHQDEDG
jgi:hypothetical protein